MGTSADPTGLQAGLSGPALGRHAHAFTRLMRPISPLGRKSVTAMKSAPRMYSQPSGHQTVKTLGAVDEEGAQHRPDQGATPADCRPDGHLDARSRAHLAGLMMPTWGT